jgi:hypothetical protein
MRRKREAEGGDDGEGMGMVSERAINDGRKHGFQWLGKNIVVDFGIFYRF